MYYVYILQNKENELYFGYTNDLKRRLKEHEDGRTFTTKGSLWELIYYEAYKAQNDALRREKQIKSYGQAWRQLKLRVSASRRYES